MTESGESTAPALSGSRLLGEVMPVNLAARLVASYLTVSIVCMLRSWLLVQK